MHHPTERMAHTTAFVTPVVDHWLEREIAQWVILQIKQNFISTNKTPLKTENVSGLKIPWGKTRTSCESLKKIVLACGVLLSHDCF